MAYTLETPVAPPASTAAAAGPAPDDVPRITIQGTRDSPPPEADTSAPSAPSAASDSGPTYTLETPVAPPSFGARVGMGAMDPINAGAQLLTNALGSNSVTQPILDLGNQANNWLADKTGLVAPIPVGGVDQMVRDRNAAYQASRGAQADTFDPARILGNVLSPANIAIGAIGAPAAGVGLATRAGMGMATGGAMGLLTSPEDTASPEDYWAKKGAQTGLSAILGGGVPVLGSKVADMISPLASTDPAFQALLAQGVKPTIGQTLGGAWNAAEEKLQSTLGLGDLIRNARMNARTTFNTASINDALSPIGGSVDGAGFDAVHSATDQSKAALDQAEAMLGRFKLDHTAETDLVRTFASAQDLPPEYRAVFNKQFQAIQSPSVISPNRVVTGDGYATIKNALTNEANDWTGGGFEKKLVDHLNDLQNAITDAGMRANPQAAQAMANARTAYAKMVRIQGAANAAKGTGGVFTPGQLGSAVKQADTSARDNLNAQGIALMQGMSRSGTQWLGNKVPDSGTAGRLALSAGGLAGAAKFGVLVPALKGTALGALAYTAPAQRALVAAVANRPTWAPAAARTLLNYSPAAVPAAANFGASLGRFY